MIWVNTDLNLYPIKKHPAHKKYLLIKRVETREWNDNVSSYLDNLHIKKPWKTKGPVTIDTLNGVQLIMFFYIISNPNIFLECVFE